MDETEGRVARAAAASPPCGALGLIWLTVQQNGRLYGEEVVVDLSLDLIGIALDAADDIPA